MKAIVNLLTYLLSFLPIILFAAFTPYLTRRSESFGIGISEESYKDDHVKKIRANYRNLVLISGVIISIIMMVIAFNNPIQISQDIIGIGIVLQLLFMFVFYLQGHRAMKLWKAKLDCTPYYKTDKTQVVVIDTDFRKRKILVSPWWFGLDFFIITVTVILGFAFYDRLSDRIPMHLNLFGQIDSWMAKSYLALLFTPAMQLCMTLLLIFVYGIIGKAKQQAEVAHPEQSLEQNRVFRFRWSAFIAFTSIAMNLMFGIMLFADLINSIAVSLVFLGIMGIVMIWAIVLCFTTGQGGSRLRIGGTKVEKASNRDEDRYWKLGIFYYNPDDAALFVEKRFGIGWTCNFARPMAWVCIIGLVIFIIGITMIQGILKK